MLEKMEQGMISIERIVEKMAHAPAILFHIEKRGFIREGYFADLVVVDKKQTTVTRDALLYKCGWSPFEGTTFSYTIDKTFVNGNLVYADGKISSSVFGQRMLFKG
jgi:dihydroorotase